MDLHRHFHHDDGHIFESLKSYLKIFEEDQYTQESVENQRKKSRIIARKLYSQDAFHEVQAETKVIQASR